MTSLVRFIVAALTLSVIGRAAFAFWEPPFTGSLEFDTIAPLGGSYFAMNHYLAGPAYALSFVALAACFVILSRRRALTLALIAAVPIVYGGLVFSHAIVAEALPFAWAADPTVMDEDAGRDLFATFNSALAGLVPSILLSQIVIGLGALLGFVALLVNRAVPRWLPIAGIAYLVLSNALPPISHAVTMVIYLLQLVLFLVLGWFTLRSTGRQVGEHGENAAVVAG